MQIIKRERNTFYIKEQSLIIGLNGGFQHLNYNIYSLQNRKPFYDFRNEILNSKEDELTKSYEILLLAQKYKLIGIHTTRPKDYEEQ